MCLEISLFVRDGGLFRGFAFDFYSVLAMREHTQVVRRRIDVNHPTIVGDVRPTAL